MNLKTYTFDNNIEIKYEDVDNNRWFVQKDIEKLFLKYGNFYKSTESENVSLPNVLIQMYDVNFNFPDNVVNFFKKSITECDDNNVRYHYLKHPTEGNLVFTNDIVAILKKKHSVFIPMKLFQDLQLNFITCNILNEIEKPLTLPPSAEIVFAVIKNENDKFKLIKATYIKKFEFQEKDNPGNFLPEGWYEVNDYNNEGWSKIDKKIYGWQHISMPNYNDFEYGESNDLTKN